MTDPIQPNPAPQPGQPSQNLPKPSMPQNPQAPVKRPQDEPHRGPVPQAEQGSSPPQPGFGPGSGRAT
jgi:hypothetical protein